MSKATGIDAQIDALFHEHYSTVGSLVRPIQRKVIHSVLEGNNTLALMPTGSGKSLCYWIAGIALKGITVVIFPLTALMDEQALKLTRHGLSVFTLHSGIDSREQYKELIDLYQSRRKPDFIFLSPERLATDGFLEFVLQSICDQIKLIVVDEAHCISQWGLDFRPFYKEIPHFLKNIFAEASLPLILCLTATLNPKDREQICADFNIEAKHVIKSDILLRTEIDIRVIKVPNEDAKDAKFWDLLEEHKDEKVLIYLDRKHGKKRSVEALCEDALQRGFRAAYFHGDMKSEAKSEIIRRFKAGDLITIFATSAFGMGIDIPDIRGVIHYLLTDSTEQYYQQIGRVGRDGLPSWAYLLYSDKNIDVRRKDFIEKSFPDINDIQKAFDILTDKRSGRRTVNYFEEGEATQSAYHYLVRSSVIQPVCKGIESLDVFRVKKGISLSEFDEMRNATRTGMLTRTAQKIGVPEAIILQKIYQWVAEQKLVSERAPGKCLVIDSLSETLPEELLDFIQQDVKEKKGDRLSLFAEYVSIIESYSSSMEFHKRIGEYLGIDKFRLNKVHQTLAGDMVRSKSEVIIANILFDRHIPYTYEAPLIAPDRSWCLPDFTVEWKGKTYYWEHLGMLDIDDYEERWKQKEKWYKQYFPGQLLITKESSTLSKESEALIASFFQ